MNEIENKINKSRTERSTKIFYDDKYWDEYWLKEFKISLDPNHQTNKNESLKRINFIKQYAKDSKIILDVGCGLGFFVYWGREENYETYGIEISRQAIDRSPNKIKKFISEGSITEIKFEDNFFDSVLCFDVLEHLYIEEIIVAIKEICRVSKKYILIRLPITGWKGDLEIHDHSHIFNSVDPDVSHVSIYPWDFWARQFDKVRKFEISKCFIYVDDNNNGETVESWMFFKRKNLND